jgi:hypothetical protein
MCMFFRVTHSSKAESQRRCGPHRLKSGAACMRSPTKAARAGIPNFARMHRLETSDADTNARITALEERVLMLETRPRPPR